MEDGGAEEERPQLIPKGSGFESHDERVLPMGFFLHKRHEYSLYISLQEADIKPD